jgi:hypothetical protein
VHGTQPNVRVFAVQPRDVVVHQSFRVIHMPIALMHTEPIACGCPIILRVQRDTDDRTLTPTR